MKLLLPIKPNWIGGGPVAVFLTVAAMLLAFTGCTSLPRDVERPASYAYTNTADTRVGRARRDEIRQHRDESGFLLLGNGLDAFIAGQSESAYQRALRDSDLANELRQKKVRFEWGQAHVVQDEPEKILAERAETRYHMAPQLRPCFRDVKDELYIFSPYFVPGKEGTAFLSESGRLPPGAQDRPERARKDRLARAG